MVELSFVVKSGKVNDLVAEKEKVTVVKSEKEPPADQACNRVDKVAVSKKEAPQKNSAAEIKRELQNIRNSTASQLPPSPEAKGPQEANKSNAMSRPVEKPLSPGAQPHCVVPEAQESSKNPEVPKEGRKNGYNSRETKINRELHRLAEEGKVELWFGTQGIDGERCISAIRSKHWRDVIDRLNVSINATNTTHGRPSENLTQCLRDCGVVPRRKAHKANRTWYDPVDGMWEFSLEAWMDRQNRLKRQYEKVGKKREPRMPHENPKPGGRALAQHGLGANLQGMDGLTYHFVGMPGAASAQSQFDLATTFAGMVTDARMGMVGAQTNAYAEAARGQAGLHSQGMGVQGLASQGLGSQGLGSLTGSSGGPCSSSTGSFAHTLQRPTPIPPHRCSVLNSFVASLNPTMAQATAQPPRPRRKPEPAIKALSVGEVTVHNVVATATLGTTIDLRATAMGLPNTQYTPQQTGLKGCVTVEIRRPRAVLRVYESGKVLCVGSTSLARAQKAMQKLAARLKAKGIAAEVQLSEASVENMAFSSRVTPPSEHQLQFLAKASKECSYDSSVFSGLKFDPDCRPGVARVFGSGKCIVAGVKSRSAAVEIVHELAELLQNPPPLLGKSLEGEEAEVEKRKGGKKRRERKEEGEEEGGGGGGGARKRQRAKEGKQVREEAERERERQGREERLLHSMAHLPASAWYAGLGQREEEEHGSEEGREERSGTSAQCEHGKRRSRCKECCGKNFCEHGKFRRADARCRECVIKLQASPSVATWLVLRALKPKGFKRDEFCMHDRRGANCPTCSPKRFCVHERRKERCKECRGSQVCEHGKLRRVCRACGGSAFCEHGREKCKCKDCGGAQVWGAGAGGGRGKRKGEAWLYSPSPRSSPSICEFELGVKEPRMEVAEEKATELRMEKRMQRGEMEEAEREAALGLLALC